VSLNDNTPKWYLHRGGASGGRLDVVEAEFVVGGRVAIRVPCGAT
jgi:hypothetical protein